MVDEQKKLKVIVVGAGICGLACGVAMRSYADVTVSPLCVRADPAIIPDASRFVFSFFPRRF